MNCFDTRKEFRAFWRRTLEPERRTAFIAHLRGCAKCDRSFRVFALSAPTLHSEFEPEARSEPLETLARARPSLTQRETFSRRGGNQWAAMAAAVIMLAVSGLAAWTAAGPSHQDVMEAIAGDNPSIEQVSYTPDASLFGQDVIGSDSLQEPLAPDTQTSQAEGLAG
jgi:anti-sigma factor RsiW